MILPDRENTMIFDDKDKCLRLARQILTHYQKRFGTNLKLRLLQLSENITYLVEYIDITQEISGRQSGARADSRAKGQIPKVSCGGTDNSRVKKAILRLCRPGYHTEEELQAETDWMLALREQLEQAALPERQLVLREQGSEWNVQGSDFGLCLRQPLTGDDGAYLYTAGEREDEKYYGMVFSYLSGTPLERLLPQQQGIWFERLGEVTALFHRQARAWKKLSGLARFHWNYETMLGEDAVWGDWRSVRGLVRPEDCRSDETGICNSDFVQCQEKFGILHRADRMIYDELQAYGMTAANYGLIHGDLRGANLLVEENCLKVIDFDDCGFGWYMQDLAASLSFVETQEWAPGLARAWLKGYQKQGILTKEDMAMIPTFIMMRRMQLLSWIHSRADAASAIAYRERFLEGTVMLAERYISRGTEYI